MNDMSLSSLYRRLLSTRAQPLVDAHDLASVMDGDSADAIGAERRDAIVAALANSPQQADLARLLNALKPASATLAEGVDKARRTAHPQRLRNARPAAGARRGHTHYLRWAGGLAACLAITLGLSLWHVEKAQHGHHHHVAKSAAPAHATPLSDRIFTSEDVIFASSNAIPHRQQASPRQGDELFRGDFAIGG